MRRYLAVGPRKCRPAHVEAPAPGQHPWPTPLANLLTPGCSLANGSSRRMAYGGFRRGARRTTNRRARRARKDGGRRAPNRSQWMSCRDTASGQRVGTVVTEAATAARDEHLYLVGRRRGGSSLPSWHYGVDGTTVLQALALRGRIEPLVSSRSDRGRPMRRWYACTAEGEAPVTWTSMVLHITATTLICPAPRRHDGVP